MARSAYAKTRDTRREPAYGSLFSDLGQFRKLRLGSMGLPECIGHPPFLMPQEKIQEMAWEAQLSRVRRGDEMTEADMDQAQRARLNRLGETLQRQLDSVEQCHGCEAHLFCLLLKRS